MSPKIHPQFWSDQAIEGQPAEIKLALLWLITNSRTTLLGVCEASERRFEFETGLDPIWLRKLSEAAPGAVSIADGLFFIRNFIRWQFGTGAKLVRNTIFKALVDAYHGLASEAVRRMVVERYPEFEEAILHGDSKGIASPCNGVRTRTSTGTGKGTTQERGMQGGKGLPTLEHARSAAAMIGGTEKQGEDFWHHFEAQSWVTAAGNPITAWQSKLKRWIDNDRQRGQAGTNGAQIVVMQDELKRVDKRISDIRNSYDAHLSPSAEDRVKLKKLRSRRDELKKKLGVEV